MSRNEITVDIREDIRAGREPFSKIMAAVAQLEPGMNLRLFAPFEPEPLYHVLAKHGFRHDTQRAANGDHEVLFTRDDTQKVPASVNCQRQEETTGAKADWIQLTSTPARILAVDARGLEPPQPLVKILEALGMLPDGTELRAHTDRRPMHLYAQLEARGFTGESQEQADGSFITHIRRC